MTRRDLVIRNITGNDIKHFYGDAIKHTVRGWAVDIDGVLVAICGVFLTRGCVIAFSEVVPDIDVPHITVWRTAKEIMRRMSGLGYRNIYAIACPKTKTAQAFLNRIGFMHIESSSRGEVFLWQAQQ